MPAVDPWQRMREDVPAARRWAYFDHAAVAPIPEPARLAVREWADAAAMDGLKAWGGWAQRMETLRQRAATMLACEAREIALVPNTTSGISLIAEGFRWKAGDNVVMLANEFPSNAYPWMNLAERGVEVRVAEVRQGGVDLTSLEALCDARTRIITASWVSYSTGWRIDLAELCERAHRRGALFFVDAIQGLGVFPLNLAEIPIDFLAADGHKWMMGPEGAGLLFVRHRHLDQLRPLNVGWHSVVHYLDYSRLELNLRPEAARYEGGSQNMVGMTGLAASLEWLTSFGLSPDQSPLAARIIENTDAACEALKRIGAVIYSHRGPACRSGIVSFTFPNADHQLLRKRCFQDGVILSCRDGRLRISPHAYMNADDLERLIAALRTGLQAN